MIYLLLAIALVGLIVVALAGFYALDRKDRRHARERHVLQNRVQHPHVYQLSEDERAEMEEHDAEPDPRAMAGAVVRE